MRTRIMYIENKADGLNGRGRIGRVTYSKSGRSLHYDGRTFRTLGGGYKANHVDVASGEQFWISGPKKRGGDRLYGTPGIEIDDDVREEYWVNIRGEPGRVNERTA